MFEYIKTKYSQVINYLGNADWVPDWIKESNRLQHFVLGFPAGLFGSFLFALGLALGMEYKDRAYANKWDWLDISATCLGGLFGQIIQTIIFEIIF